MDLGHNVMLLRKKKGISQADLGKMIGTSGDVVGRYERGDITPSIEVASKIADALEVSIDYLVGKTDLLLDKKILNRIIGIQKLSEQDQSHVFAMIDAYLRDAKARKTYS